MSTRNPLYIDSNRLAVKKWRKIYHPNTNKKKGGVSILV